MFCGNDEVAAGVLQSARKAGLLGAARDLSVSSASMISRSAQAVWPPLTTVAHADRAEIGKMATPEESDRRRAAGAAGT
ncbi:hypothetical protein ACRAWD_19585 [Caulobacter segnis]